MFFSVSALMSPTQSTVLSSSKQEVITASNSVTHKLWVLSGWGHIRGLGWSRAKPDDKCCVFTVKIFRLHTKCLLIHVGSFLCSDCEIKIKKNCTEQLWAVIRAEIRGCYNDGSTLTWADFLLTFSLSDTWIWFVNGKMMFLNGNLADC